MPGFFVEYYPLQIAEYATGLQLSDWLYSLWHGIKDSSYHILSIIATNTLELPARKTSHARSIALLRARNSRT